MEFSLLPFIKSSKKVKRYGGAIKCTAPFNGDSSTHNSQKSTKVWRNAGNHGVQDLPPPAQLLKKSSNSSGRKRSREMDGIEQHLAQLKRKQSEIDNTSDNSKLSSIDTQPPENSSPQEVPSSPILKRARNTFSDLNPPFYTEDNHTTYQVSIDHDWEEAPVDVAVPKVTVKRIRKPNPSFTDINTGHQNLFQGESQFLPFFHEAELTEMIPNSISRCDEDPCSTNTLLNILPHEE